MVKRVLTKYGKLPIEVKKSLKKEYPYGYENILTTIRMVSNGESTSALLYNYNDTQYLIKYTPMKRKSVIKDSDELDDNNHSDDELNISTGGEWYEDND